MNCKAELEELKSIYEKTHKEIQERHDFQLIQLIGVMKNFIKIYEVKNDCKTKMSNVESKLEYFKGFNKQENSLEDIKKMMSFCCLEKDGEEEEDDE